MAGGRSVDTIRFGIAHEKITVDDTVGGVGFTTALAANANRIFVTAETADMRFRYCGGAPTTTVGHLIGDGDTLTLYGTQNIKNFRAIKTSETNGVLMATHEA